MAQWSDVGAWEGDGLRREAFFFPMGGVELYGSAYGPAPAGPASFGAVICNSWGYEANLASPIVHSLSIAIARAGGVAINFHYPGFGDSQGDFEATTVDRMANAVRAAVDEASRRHPGLGWTLVGLMLGASVAAMATAGGAAAERLLLVQPALRPGSYFARLARASKRSLGGAAPEPAPGFAYGYPLTPPMLEAAAAADTEVAAALDEFEGDGAIVRYEKPAVIEGAPERFEQIRVSGIWRFGAKGTSALGHPAAEWLGKRLPVGSR